MTISANEVHRFQDQLNAACATSGQKFDFWIASVLYEALIAQDGVQGFRQAYETLNAKEKK